MKRHCKTCKKEFEGEDWKTQCWDCYKNFKGRPRIEAMRGRGVFIMTHPDVTEEEVNEWIKVKYGSVKDPSNWGAVEQKDKFKVWFNCQNDD